MLAAAKWGALIGVGSYLILVIGLTLIDALLFGNSPADLNHPGTLTFACLGIFGLLFAFSAAGYFTGRETLKAGLGAVSAMIAFAAYRLLSLIYTPGSTSSGATTTTAKGQSIPFAAQIAFALIAALIVFGFAALMGWLGARPAVQQAQKRRLLNATAAAVTTPMQDATLPAEDAH